MVCGCIRSRFFLIFGTLKATSFPPFLEPAGGEFVAVSGRAVIRISPRKIRFSSVQGNRITALERRGANRRTLTAENPSSGVTRYFAGGDGTQRHVSVPRYSRIRAADLYSRIDLAYYFDRNRFEFDLELHPGADPKLLRFALPGAANLLVNTHGDLTVQIEEQTLAFQSPRAYQILRGVHQEVECQYQMDSQGLVGFRLGSYDRRRDLIIDPVVQFLT
jgi:hypothetical protein